MPPTSTIYWVHIYLARSPNYFFCSLCSVLVLDGPGQSFCILGWFFWPSVAAEVISFSKFLANWSKLTLSISLYHRSHSGLGTASRPKILRTPSSGLLLYCVAKSYFRITAAHFRSFSPGSLHLVSYYEDRWPLITMRGSSCRLCFHFGKKRRKDRRSRTAGAQLSSAFFNMSLANDTSAHRSSRSTWTSTLPSPYALASVIIFLSLPYTGAASMIGLLTSFNVLHAFPCRAFHCCLHSGRTGHCRDALSLWTQFLQVPHTATLLLLKSGLKMLRKKCSEPKKSHQPTHRSWLRRLMDRLCVLVEEPQTLVTDCMARYSGFSSPRNTLREL